MLRCDFPALTASRVVGLGTGPLHAASVQPHEVEAGELRNDPWRGSTEAWALAHWFRQAKVAKAQQLHRSLTRGF